MAVQGALISVIPENVKSLAFLFSLLQQVVSQQTMNNMTSSNSTYHPTTTGTQNLSSLVNSTSPTGAAVSLNAGGLSVLTPVIMAVFLLKHYC